MGSGAGEGYTSYLVGSAVASVSLTALRWGPS